MIYSSYIKCPIPAILFHIVTTRYKSAPTWTLAVICIWQIALPVALDGQAPSVDLNVCAVVSVILAAAMFSFIAKRNEDKSITTLYDVLYQWKQMITTHAPHAKQEPAISQIRCDAFWLLIKAMIQIVFCIPVFAVSDGFVRVCQEPPESLWTTTPYLVRFLSSPIQISSRTLFYYLWIGITLALHIAIVSPLYFLFSTIQLNVVVWLPFGKSLQNSLYHEVIAFDTKPPLFRQLWRTRSVYDLWSRRWHQFFRHGFRHIAYHPARQLFGKHEKVGRLVGTVAVFLCSGIMHDYIVLSMLGYSSIQPGVVGQQTIFFILQGMATAISVLSPTLPVWLARTLTWIWIVYTAPIFGEPYIRLGLHHYAQVPGFPPLLDNYIGVICPFSSK